MIRVLTVANVQMQRLFTVLNNLDPDIVSADQYIQFLNSSESTSTFWKFDPLLLTVTYIF